jgi:hypothetical protein
MLLLPGSVLLGPGGSMPKTTLSRLRSRRFRKTRGFSHIKTRHLAAAKAEEVALLERLRSGPPQYLKAAE